MRPTFRLAACATVLATCASTAPAQGVFDRIKKKAADAVEKKAEDKLNAKIDAMSQRLVDNSFDAFFGDSANPAPGAANGTAGTANGTAGTANAAAGTANGAAGTSGGGAAKRSGPGMPFSIGSNAKTEPNYTFDVVTTMEIASSKHPANSDGKVAMKTFFNSNEPYTGTSISDPGGKKPDGSAFVILDARNQAMVMLMATDKQKFSITYDWKDAQKFAQSVASSAPAEKVNWDTVKVWQNFSRIGTRTIAGYAADGYRAQSADGTVEVWVSHDPKLSVGRMFGASSSLKQMKGRLPADYPVGMLLEMTSQNTSSGEQVTMRVTNIDTNAHVIYAMADYPKMAMGKQ